MARIPVALAAVVVCAWFGVGIRQAHQLTAAQAIVQSARDVTPAQATRARSLLRSAATLNPDRAVSMTRGQLDLRVGDSRAATRVFTDVLRAEPKNVEAWLGLSQASYGKPELVRAVAMIAVLDPQDAKHR